MKENRLKLLSIYGTRPEAIKLAPVILGLRDSPEFRSFTCVTAQHREMMDQINSLFGIQPDFDLNVMASNQSLHSLSAHIFSKLTPVIEAVKPDWILVQGDTTTAMIASLAGYYQRIKVAHIEAGLRSKNKWEPFPEEINRRIIDVVADLHFAPTQLAQENLRKEGIPLQNIVISGNTIVDALQLISRKDFPLEESVLADIPWDKKIILVTAHRRENIGVPLENICRAISDLAASHQGLHFVFPVHRNPEVERIVRSLLDHTPNVALLPPLEYRAFIHLLQNCHFVLTDSGGIQEEAPTFGKLVLILRNTTERPEGVEAGFARLVGTERDRIVQEVNTLLENPAGLRKIAAGTNPYGDGKASQRIIEAVKNYKLPDG
jgi:UDP-N-acetylglucosamine 2-epimerase (non-hydrolysing)